MLGSLVSLIRECKSRLKLKLRGNYTLKENHPGQANCKSAATQNRRMGKARKNTHAFRVRLAWRSATWQKMRASEKDQRSPRDQKRSVLKKETEKKKKETLHLSDSGLHGRL